MKAIWWIRRDLRLTDNLALTKAINQADMVIPVFVIDPVLMEGQKASTKRLAFLWEGLRQLDSDLNMRGSRLIVQRGRPEQVLTDMVASTGAGKIFAEADFSPYVRKRDNVVAAHVDLELIGGPGLHHPAKVVKPKGSPYTVYTPFKNTWKLQLLPQLDSIQPAPEHIATPEGIETCELPDLHGYDRNIHFKSGETEAQLRLYHFVKGKTAPIREYFNQRNRMDLDGTSQISPYLRFGMLSTRQVVVTALTELSKAEKEEGHEGAETWLNELIWREFYISILYHFPDVLSQSFRADSRNIPWRNDLQEFHAWCKGLTGYPVVDAGMRQLETTGWVHNRAGMIVVSFLVKDLLVDWRRGESWFMQLPLDGDPAANNGGWQWTAGTGTDAAPYFRIFNPVLQGMKFDPQGVYIRRWVPELGNVPDEHIHQPWKMPVDIQRSAGCVVGLDYPQPIVDHAQAREWTLAAYRHQSKK